MAPTTTSPGPSMTPGAGPHHLSRSVGVHDHTIGPLHAPLTLVEYGDFECPHCRRAHPIVQALIERLGERMCFAYRHFPLTQLHPHAQLAAEAAEAAGAQDRFWELHDLFFERPDLLELRDLQAIALELGIDADRFARNLEDRRFEGRVRDMFLTGIRSGVSETPTFFINGKRHDGAWDLESLHKAIEGAEGHREPPPVW